MLEDKQYLNAAWVIQNVIGEDLPTQLAARFERKEHPEVKGRYDRACLFWNDS